MLTYVMLGRWTEKGIGNIKQSPGRLDAVKKAIQSAGGKAKDFYMVMGQYDFVFISEAPNDEAFAKTVLAVASQGNVRTESLKAFTEDEYRKIVGGLP